VAVYWIDQLGALNTDMKSIEHGKLVAGLAAAPNKAFIIGEFGMFKNSFPELSAGTGWLTDMIRRFPVLGAAGWIYWTYDTDEQKRVERNVPQRRALQRTEGNQANNEWLGEMIDQIRNATPPSHLTEHQVGLEDIEDINDYSKGFHHDQNQNTGEAKPIDRAELETYVRRTLRIIGSA
jgi:hypothetical protein